MNEEAVPLAIVARVHASLRAKAPLGDTLHAVNLTHEAWREADERWTDRLVSAAEDDPTLLVAYDLALADAWDELAPRIEPYETDAAAWVALEEVLIGNPEPLKALAVAGVELGDMPRLRRIWKRRADADASVAAALVEARRDPPMLVRAKRVDRTPAAKTAVNPLALEAPVAAPLAPPPPPLHAPPLAPPAASAFAPPAAALAPSAPAVAPLPPSAQPPLAAPPAVPAGPVGSGTAMAFELPSHLRQAVPFKKQDAPVPPPASKAPAAPVAAAAPVPTGTAMSFELPANLRALPFPNAPAPPLPTPPAPPAPPIAASPVSAAPAPPPAPKHLGATAMVFELPANLRALPFPSPGAAGSEAPKAPAPPPAPANARATPFEPQAGPLVIAGFTLEQYARVSAEVEGVPDPEPIFARYGLADRSRRAIVATAWQERLARDPAARAQWMEIYPRLRRR